MGEQTRGRAARAPDAEVIVQYDIPDSPVDPDLLLFDEGIEASVDADSEFPDESVESYVPPYVPDPPPAPPAQDRVRTYEEKSPRWFRTLVLLAVALVITAIAAVLHSQGVLEEWAARLTPKPMGADSVAAPESENATTRPPVRPDPVAGTRPPSDDPRHGNLQPPIRTEGTAKPFPDQEPIGRRLPDPRRALDHPAPPITVRTSDNREITLLPGEILVELRNGNFLKGRLHKITPVALRLAMKGGYVDVELTRLRAPKGEGDAPYKSYRTYPRTRLYLVTGEVLSGRLLKSTDDEVELVFPSGKVALRRDMVSRMQRY